MPLEVRIHLSQERRWPLIERPRTEYIVVFKDSVSPDQIEHYVKEVNSNGVFP